MHELGIADAICKTVTRIVGENGVEHLRSVTVEVGDLSGVVPRFLLDCWEAVTAGSALAGVRLLLHAGHGQMRGLRQCICSGHRVPALPRLRR